VYVAFFRRTDVLVLYVHSSHPFAGVELVPSSKRSVCPLYFNLAPLLIHLVLYVDLV
jgi:hypothetical protein